MISKLTPLLVFIGLLVAPYSASAQATHLFTCSSAQFIVDTAKAFYTTGDRSVVAKAIKEGKCAPVPIDTVFMAEGAGYVKDVGQTVIDGQDMVIYRAEIPGHAPFYYIWKKTSA